MAPRLGEGSRFSRRMQGHRGAMASARIKILHKPGEVWLSCPPFLMMARIVAVETEGGGPVVSYELHDADGALLQAVEHATLDSGWWRTVKRLEPRFG